MSSKISKIDTQEILRQEYSKLIESRVLPLLADMLDVDLDLAMKADKLGRDTREAILNRVLGKPIEMSRIDSQQVITINITRLEDDDSIVTSNDRVRGSMVKDMELSNSMISGLLPEPTSTLDTISTTSTSTKDDDTPHTSKKVPSKVKDTSRDVNLPKNDQIGRKKPKLVNPPTLSEISERTIDTQKLGNSIRSFE